MVVESLFTSQELNKLDIFREFPSSFVNNSTKRDDSNQSELLEGSACSQGSAKGMATGGKRKKRRTINMPKPKPRKRSSVCTHEDSRNDKTLESGKQGSSKKLKKSMLILEKDYDSLDMEDVTEMILADERNVRNFKPDGWVGLSKTSEMIPCYNERQTGGKKYLKSPKVGKSRMIKAAKCDENDMQSRVGIRRDKESGKEYQVVLNDKDENSNYHSTGCMCSLITDNDYEENIDIKEEEESEVSWVKEAIEANSSKSDSQQFSKLENVIENSNKSENSLRYYTSGEWKIPLSTWNEGFEVCKCFDDGEVVLAKLKILADGSRGKQKALQDMRFVVQEGKVILEDSKHSGAALPGAAFKVPKGMTYNIINEEKVDAILFVQTNSFKNELISKD